MAGFINGTYGKYVNIDTESTVIMEYSNFLPFFIQFLNVTNNTQFNTWIDSNSDLLY